MTAVEWIMPVVAVGAILVSGGASLGTIKRELVELRNSVNELRDTVGRIVR